MATADLRYGKGYRFEKDGWIYLHIEGDAFERGKQHGYLVAKEIADILRSLKFLTYQNTGQRWEECLEQAELFMPPNHAGFDEYMDEIKGIADGAKEGGAEGITWREILTLNVYVEMVDYCWPNSAPPEQRHHRGDRIPGHCSAFVAVAPQPHGHSTIIMAHNSWDEFAMGQFYNLILDILPEHGERMLMQSCPGLIDSGTDFFVTSAGIMGTETTMGGFHNYASDHTIAECFRVRQAMQYGESLDGFVTVMCDRNSGGYANSWLLADIRTKEIMRFELGQKYWNVERKTEGNFIGFNAAIDPRIRNLECSNTGYADIRRHQGARQVRLGQLMDECGANLDVQTAKMIIADHHDVYLNQRDGVWKENPCSRTVCGHYDLDPREYMSQPGRPLPFQPRGTYDGKVMDSDMAAKMSFWARWGNSCGMPFIADEFLKKHPQWNDLKGYLKDRPGQPWSRFITDQRE